MKHDHFKHIINSRQLWGLIFDILHVVCLLSKAEGTREEECGRTPEGPFVAEE